MVFIEKNMRGVYGVYIDIVRGTIRVTESHLRGMKAKLKKKKRVFLEFSVHFHNRCTFGVS